MPTTEELQEEIKSLKAQLVKAQAQLIEKGAEKDPDTLEVGQEHFIAIGFAQIVRFYEEDGIQKVQCLLRKFNPIDGKTLIDEDGVLCSFPVEKFPILATQYRRDQAAREFDLFVRNQK